MSMVPGRDPAICPVCGERREGGCHACPGPVIVCQGKQEDKPEHDEQETRS